MKQSQNPAKPIALTGKRSSEPSPLDQFRHRSQELIKAYGRIGRTPEKALDWLVKFVTKDLSTLSGGDVWNLQHEICWFAVYGPPLSGVVPSSEDLQAQSLDPRYELPSNESILWLQQFTRERLNQFISHWQTDIKINSDSILTVTRDRKKGVTGLRLVTEDMRQGFAFSLAHTLKVQGARLAHCPECSKYFSARLNQVYCSARCQNQVSLRTYRSKQKNRKIKRKVRKKSVGRSR